ncbi:phage tail protein [Acuticoccus mangrovi]|uniref:Phage tail protein n=1 Tax=Acuticoccus mangrovi TaxID=2796142 RepID=A0A934IPL6_9HYPH|nr:phage tail protein [Acuticoccus mangrovi]MBJ3776405.1 phage tail protein [Acuticoccus mangrovi]
MCDGFVIEAATTLREAVQPLSLAFLFDLVARGAEVRAVTRRAAPLRATLDPARLVASGTKAAVKRKRAQETELPRVARLNYLDAEGAYSSAVVQAERLATTSEQTADATLPVVIDQARAQAIVDAWLADLWAARDVMSFALPRASLGLEPGDVVELEAASVVRCVRLTRLTDGTGREAEATGFAAAPFRVTEAASRPARRRSGGRSAPNAFLEVMDLPQVGASDAGKPMLAAHGQPWGGAAVYRSPTTDGWTLDQVIGARASIGETREDLAAGPAGRWHRVTVRVALYSGTLASVTDLELFEGANTFALEVDGAGSNVWEVFQARDAVPGPSSGVYDFSMLLRGQRGTDHRIRGNVASGARIVRLDGGGIVQPARFDASDIGRAINWRAGPATKPINDGSYATEAITCRGEGLKPFAPAHLRMVREASGDVVLSWVRRTRVGGDIWPDEDDVPLGEASERYEVRILDGGTVRMFTATAPTVTYTAAQQTADFGGLPTAITARVAQLSTTVGRGATRTLTVTF